MAISVPGYGCYLVIYIHPLYRLRCHFCRSVTSRRAPQQLASIDDRFFFTLITASSRAWFCEFSFCYFIAALSASRICFSRSSAALVAASSIVSSRTATRLVYIYVEYPLPYPHPHPHPPRLAVTYKQRNICLCRLVSNNCTFTGPHSVAISLAISHNLFFLTHPTSTSIASTYNHPSISVLVQQNFLSWGHVVK